MTQNLSPKLLHDLETHYHNIEVLYNDNLNPEDIREKLNIDFEDWIPMHSVIFSEESIYKANNTFGKIIYYKYNNYTGKTQEVTHG